jgi:hypothetical protein
VETPLPVDFKKILPPELEASAGSLGFTASVSPTLETRKIGQWNCQAYDVRLTIMSYEIRMKIWTTRDVPFDIDAYDAKLSPHILARQTMLDDRSRQEMMKIKGYQVAAEMNGDLLGTKIRSTSEVVEMVKRTPPTGLFTPPANYVKKDMLSLEDVPGR